MIKMRKKTYFWLLKGTRAVKTLLNTQRFLTSREDLWVFLGFTLLLCSPSSSSIIPSACFQILHWSCSAPQTHTVSSKHTFSFYRMQNAPVRLMFFGRFESCSCWFDAVDCANMALSNHNEDSGHHVKSTYLLLTFVMYVQMICLFVPLK